MAQTTLSAAKPASPEPRGVRWHRTAHRGGHSCLPRGMKGLCAFAAPSVHWMADTAASLAAEILIANLELKLGLTHRKLSPLRISNRKYSRVSRSPRVCPEIRRTQGAPHKPFVLTTHSPLVTRHSPLTCPEEDHRRRRVTAFLIYGTAIKTPRNPLKTRILTFFNRR
jgi:hypothetical protein